MKAIFVYFRDVQDPFLLDLVNFKKIELLDLLQELLLLGVKNEDLVISSLVMITPKQDILDRVQDILKEDLNYVLKLRSCHSELNLLEKLLHFEDNTQTKR